MRSYHYAGVDAAGEPVEGRIRAAGPDAAADLLSAGGVDVSTLREPWWTRELGTARVPNGSVAVFTRLMASLIRSGVRPREALEVLHDEMPGAALRAVLYDLSIKVQRGMRLSDATRDHPRVFSEVYCAALAAGEDAGALKRVLERLSVGLQRTEATRRKVIGALTYPAVVLAIVAAVGLGLLYFIVPQFAEVLTGSGAELPAVTRLLLGASVVARTGGPAALGAGVVAVVATRAAARRSTAFRRRLHALQLRTPLLAPLIVYAAMANFARIFALLHSSRSNVVEAVRLAADTVPNLAVRRALYDVAEGHAGGRALSEEMRRVGVVPPILVAMTSVGERSGSLADQMEAAADFYEEELAFRVDRMTTLLGPLLIVLAFAPVITLVLGIYIPMIQAVRAMG